MVRLLSLSPNSTISSTELVLELEVLVDSQLMERNFLLLTNGMVNSESVCCGLSLVMSTAKNLKTKLKVHVGARLGPDLCSFDQDGINGEQMEHDSRDKS